MEIEMKQLTLFTVFALFANVALADTNNSGLPADYTRGAAACDATEDDDRQTTSASVDPVSLTTAQAGEQPSEPSCPFNSGQAYCPEVE